MNLCTSWDSQLPPKTSTTSDPHMYPHNLTYCDTAGDLLNVNSGVEPLYHPRNHLSLVMFAWSSTDGPALGSLPSDSDIRE
jgi:hypothetical protein